MKTKLKTIRVSVPIRPDVLAKFQKYSLASGLSVSKSIGDWLKDTVSGLDAMTDILERHKRSPAQAMEKLTSYASALHEMTGEVMVHMKAGTSSKTSAEGKPGGAAIAATGPGEAAPDLFSEAIPPSSNTGGKGTKNNSKLPIAAKALSHISRENKISPKEGKSLLPIAKRSLPR